MNLKFLPNKIKKIELKYIKFLRFISINITYQSNITNDLQIKKRN